MPNCKYGLSTVLSFLSVVYKSFTKQGSETLGKEIKGIAIQPGDKRKGRKRRRIIPLPLITAAQSLRQDGLGKGGTISSSITDGWSQTTGEMETRRLRAAAAFSGRNICESLHSSNRGGGVGTGRERSQGCAHTDNCPWTVSQAAAAALPSPVRDEAKTSMWDKQSKCQHSLSLQHPVSCDAF